MRPTHLHRRLRHGQPALGAEGARSTSRPRPRSRSPPIPTAIRRADRVVFPGQGAMPDCMRAWTSSGLGEAVVEAPRASPFLGICIGQQMLFEAQRRGRHAGPRRSCRAACAGFRPRAPRRGLKIPHMGWNEVWQAAPHALWEGIADGSRFYFVHSYYCEPARRRARRGEHPLSRRLYLAPSRGIIFSRRSSIPRRAAPRGCKLLSNFATLESREVPPRPPC